MDTRLKVDLILPDPNSESQIVILKNEDGEEILPVWVGTTEGNAIRLAMEGIIPPRPMTHDLLVNLLVNLRIKITKITIQEVKNNTYFASISIQKEGKDINIDSRPSDAIAIALRSNAPIYATQEILEKSNSRGSLDLWLEKLKPRDRKDYDA